MTETNTTEIAELFTFPSCDKCYKAKEILDAKGVDYEEVNSGLGKGRKRFQQFYREYRESIKRDETGQTLLPILLKDSEMYQGLEEISSHFA